MIGPTVGGSSANLNLPANHVSCIVSMSESVRVGSFPSYLLALFMAMLCHGEAFKQAKEG